ncbi:DNA polymerase zeta catalytic subunit [Seiridium cupressi]
MDVFRVRLNCIDHYQAVQTKYDPPLRNDFRLSQASKEPKVPVVRVFGSTETGQKVCAHIHGAFPYLYVEYTGSLDPDDVGAYIYRLHLSIDHALTVSYRRNACAENPKFVARITLCKGVPFYGYHVGYRFYLKIYMLTPLVMTRLAELLQQGVIMKRVFQPYEAHLQYLLQFMTDYNLYGCDYIKARKVRFRAPVPQHDDEDKQTIHLWHSQSVSTACITDDVELPRVSHCSIEVDICVQDILNRHDIKERQLHHDFTEMHNPLPDDMKLVASMAGLWQDETKRRKRRMVNPAPGSSPFPPEVLISMSADTRNSRVPGWIHEDEYREQIYELIEGERIQSDGNSVNFNNFIEPVSFEDDINTMLQSVEDLYPENLAPVLGLSGVPLDGDDVPASSVEVDEQRILDTRGADDGMFPDDSDEEILRRSRVDDAGKRAGNDISTKPTSASLRRLGELVKHPSSPIASANGLYASSLKTGMILQAPISSDLRSAALRHGLISKTSRNGYDKVQPENVAKRSGTSTDEKHDAKRRRVELAFDSFSASQDGFREKHSRVEEPPDDKPSSQHLEPPSSQTSKAKAKAENNKSSGNQTLKFPVVKNPNDPSTQLRLSQQSQHRGLQASQDSTLKKQVTFDPTITAIDNPTISTTEAGKMGSISSSGSTGRARSVGKPVDIGCLPRPDTHFFVFTNPPPAIKDITSTMDISDRPDVIYQDAYYSKDKDVPLRVREYAGQEFRLVSNTLPFLPNFDETGSSPGTFGIKPECPGPRSTDEKMFKASRRECSIRSWEFAEPPPSYKEVEDWLLENQRTKISTSGSTISVQDPELRPYLSQIDGATPKKFKYSQKKKSTSVQFEAQYMSTMSLEIHVNTRGSLVPNPEEDEVQCIFWCSKSDENFATGDNASLDIKSGIIILSEDGVMTRTLQRQTPVEIIEEISELDLMVRMVEIVRTHDPDILTGYEVHGSSWGYLVERARLKYDYNLCDEFSRMKSQSFGRFGKESDKWGFNTTSTIRVTGRHMINIWRAMRGELNLLQYTMENVTWHLLHRRIPHYSWRTLSDWYLGGKSRDLSKLLRYYLTRTKLDIDILEANELIPRTSEQARLLGVDFFSVFSRGSQFKVESIMFRIAKPENFMLVSPDRKQVGGQNALECLPLVMEPQSAFYSSPVLVLDFQSLYPSVMIAYNYCYSTFLGRIVNWRGTNKMGFTDYTRQERLLELLKDYINIAPNGIMYCKPHVRKSLLAKMLGEILETRVMVKSGMKQDKQDKALQQLLNNRQLALKLLANVTYGYTSASFSGRMPCSEIADSIVQTGRETLERAIALIHSVQKWKAEVVYGDTDSLFVHLPGRTKDQAFDIGNEITKTITDMNPRPVKLKFEKVYHPCVLLAKKRYVGYKFESREQVKPDFDAKGIETVRRDGTPAEQMIEEKALKILFETADLSQVKSYFQIQCEKIMLGTVSIQDFCFAKEVKLGTYSNKAPPPPGAMISTKRMLEDARAEPQYGERVPYVVVTGGPRARLIDRCVAPEDLLINSHLQLDAEYYISKNLIPPLERIFNLVGANVRGWYDEMPKVQRIHRVEQDGVMTKKTLESYMQSASCLVCNNRIKDGGPICERCLTDVPASLLKLQSQLRTEEKKYIDVLSICKSCASLAPLDEVPCDSKDCPVFYTRMKQAAKYRMERGLVEPAVKQLIDVVERQDLEW